MNTGTFVEPRSYQRDHYAKLEKVLDECNFYLDKSKPGAGKTYPPIYFAQKYNLPVFVICPLTVEDTWNRAKKNYNFKIIDIVAYASIRSVKNKQPKHGLLDRFDNTINDGIEKVEFKATEKLIEMVETGVLFVFDECHNLKNRTAQWKACKEIARTIIKSENKKSKLCLLSGTPFDKPEHAKQFMELVGIIQAHYMYRSVNNNLIIEGFGLQELIDYGNKCNPELTQLYLDKHKFKFLNTKNIEKFITNFTYDIFIDVFCKKFSSVIPEDHSRSVDLKSSELTQNITNNNLIPDLGNIVSNYLFVEDKKNGYYNVDPELELKIVKGISALAKSVSYVDGAITENKINFGSVTVCLKALEILKTEIFIRAATEKLRQDPSNKVILFFNYTDSINKCATELKEYNPLILTGQTRKRGELIEKFNNNPMYRLLIGNIKVGGTGIELDDKVGNSPRSLFISPSYFMIEMHQATLRIFRENTKSNAFTRFVYANILTGTSLMRESKILEALARKSKVLKSIQYESRDYKYPGDYEDEYEGVSTELSIELNKLARKQYEAVEVIKGSKKKESKSEEE